MSDKHSLKHIDISLNNEKLEAVSEFRYLGVVW